MQNKANETMLEAAERIYHGWDEALSRNDVEAIMRFYHPDIVIESPLICHLLGKEKGICQGQVELRQFIEAVATRKPSLRKFYRERYFTDGKILMWEYPRLCPNGEQMDFMEVMELEDGLIRKHRIYWGWYGFNVMRNNRYWSDATLVRE